MTPLATMLRPEILEDFIGQEHLVGENGAIKRLIESEKIPSMIFWGPPGTGKTTLALLLAKHIQAEFFTLSAVTDGKKDLQKIIQIAKQNTDYNKQTILFIDEIHRWSKLQQDSLLPVVESGTITLIGATTENPSFTVISPLLSRARVFVFKEHKVDDITKAVEKGLITLKLSMSDKDKQYLAELSNGDMRFALNTLEIGANLANNGNIGKNEIENAAQKFLRYDKGGEEHYNIISAVHKSLRSSNASAAVYWILRMLEAGEDPLYIVRRLIRFASEDIGNASPNALLLANVVFETCQRIGMPECRVAIIQLAEYLANAPKNNSAYIAEHMGLEDVRKHGNLPVPLHIRNAPTKLMEDLGYGKGYQYDHDLPGKKSDQQLFPDEIKDRDYFPKK